MPGVTAELAVVEGDSSPSLLPQRTTSSASAESNFRELDDAYLQNQARIWLGEVLQIRFDEQLDISDLLADGELLFEVSEVISRMLPTLSVDETQLKGSEWKSLALNKSTRRYMPYYNVDSFLRMCKSLGMDSIDLFTPSDVVDRRNTRKVCMCLRSLSKKSRLRDLNVPDFDRVTCTVAMSTDMVECIRKSLEMSQSNSSLSVEQDVQKDSRIRVWRRSRMSNSDSAVSNGYSDNGDEAESRFVVAESNGSSDYADDAESLNISGSQVLKEYNSELQLSRSTDFKNEVDDLCEYLSPSKAESVGSPCSQYYSDEELSLPSSNGLGSHISGEVLELNSETNHGYQIGDVSHVPIDWGDSHFNLGNYHDANANDDKVDCVSHDTDVDTTCSHDFYLTEKDTSHEHFGILDNPSKVDCEKSLELGEHLECVVTDDFHVGDCGEAPCLSRGDVHAPSDNIGAKHETFIGEVGPNIDAPSSHGKSNDKALSGELLIRSSCVSISPENPNLLYNSENQASNACTEVINVGGNSCCDRSKNENATSVDEASQLSSHEEQSPCPGDGHSCKSSTLLAIKSNGNDHHWIPAKSVAPSETSILPSLLDNDSVICSDLHCSPIKKDIESFDDNKITPDYTEQNSDIDFMDGNASNPLDIPNKDLAFSPCMAVGAVNSSTNCSKDCHDAAEGSEGHKGFVESVDGKPTDIDSTVLVNSVATVLCDPQQEAESPKFVEDSDQKHHQCEKEVEKGISELVKQEGTDKEIPVHKPQRKLFKSVVKGTALLGVVVFLLHIRKSRQKNLSEAKKQPTHIVIQGTTNPSQKSHKVGSTSSVYPAEKLHFGM